MSARESFDAMCDRMERERDERQAQVRDAFATSPAILLTGERRDEIVILSGEPSFPEEGPMRATRLANDGPWGHDVGTREKLIEVVAGYGFVAVRAITEAEVMAWTATETFTQGARAVAFIQADNAIRFLAAERGLRERTDEVLRVARGLFYTDPDAATDMLHAEIREMETRPVAA